MSLDAANRLALSTTSQTSEPLALFRALLAPTREFAIGWAIGFVAVVALWVLYVNTRLTTLLERIRHEDPHLWQELGSPATWNEIATTNGRRTMRRLRIDDAYAAQFNPLVIADLRVMQRRITIGLVVGALLGLLALLLIWPLRLATR
jgi:hypothetical protein